VDTSSRDMREISDTPGSTQSGPTIQGRLPTELKSTAVESQTSGRRLLFEMAVLILAAVIGAFGMKIFIAQVFSIPSTSMKNTLTVGERVAVEKISYRISEPVRGDVVVFDGSGLFAQPTPGARTFVKRVIGLPGERVTCCDADGRLLVEGVALDEGEYLKPGDSASESRFDVLVPPEKVWVMGDHRSASADSRAYLGAPGGGFIPVERIVGKAKWVIWPLSSARSVQSPTYGSQPK
jgi:signal peptidase I